MTRPATQVLDREQPVSPYLTPEAERRDFDRIIAAGHQRRLVATFWIVVLGLNVAFWVGLVWFVASREHGL